MRILSSLLLGRRLSQSHFKAYSKVLTSHVNNKVSMHERDLLDHSFQGYTFFRSQQHYTHYCTLRNQTDNSNRLEVEIITKEFVKPKTPTPPQLKNYEVAIFNQISPNVYMSFVYFYPNNHQSNDDLILKRRQALKQFLSEALVKLYPLAGRIKDSRFIDCNDEGVYYVEAKVKDHLSDFLKHNPDNKLIHQLLPVDPNSEELLSRKDLVMIQVTIFGCGGISVGFYSGHKILDFSSIVTFLKCWSSTSRPSSEQINPTFISGLIYPSNPRLPADATIAQYPLYSKTNNSTRRFLFRAASLAALKQKTGSSRVLAVSALIWKCAVAASKSQAKSINGTAKNATLALAVSLRDKSSPPSPPFSIGNVITLAPPITCSESDDLELNLCAQRLKDATKLFTSEYIDAWRGYLSSDVEGTILNEVKTWYSDKVANHMIVTSICKSGKYEIDFGWGKPVWVCVGNGSSKFQYSENFVILMDTRCGTGMESWVTLSEEDMAVFERDPEILAFASLNASPLELVE